MRSGRFFFAQFQTEDSSITLWADKRLVERVVTQAADEAMRQGPLERYRQYRAAVDPVFERPPQEREAAFQRAFAELFGAWGFPERLIRLLDEFPRMREEVGEIVLIWAAAPRDEAVDWERAVQEEKKRALGNRLTVQRFRDPDALIRYLRHEWFHLDQMLDPAFHYERSQPWSDQPPMLENLYRTRYRVLWCTAIDGRIARRGEQPAASPETYQAELNRLFRRLPADWRMAIFRRLWDGEPIDHPTLVALAESKEAFRVFAQTGSLEEAQAAARVQGATTPLPAPGEPCPLCRFPTFRWVVPPAMAQPEEDVLVGESEVLARIRAHHPHWEPEQGVCERCYERYVFLGLSA